MEAIDYFIAAASQRNIRLVLGFTVIIIYNSIYKSLLIISINSLYYLI